MSELTRDFAKKQCKRLAAVPIYQPQSDDAAKEILDALMAHCQSREHAEHVMTTFIQTARDVKNVVAEFISIARDTGEAFGTLPDGCDDCRIGKDPFTGEMRWATHLPAVQGGYTCAVRCTCKRGQILAQRDAARRGERRRSPDMQRADFKALAGGDQ
jgi:hypothetical protein